MLKNIRADFKKDTDTLEYLGLNDKETLNKLRRKYRAIIKEHIYNVLANVEKYIEQENYKALENMLAYSPAGDDMGLDNHFICFGMENNHELDIKDMISLLENFKDEE